MSVYLLTGEEEVGIGINMSHFHIIIGKAKGEKPSNFTCCTVGS